MRRLLGSLLGLLCTQVCCVKGMQVEQRPSSLIIQEGNNSTLQCNFSASVTSVQWFLQNPGGRLINLFYVPSGTKRNGRLTATTVTRERHSSLYISSSQNTDSATYFCAVDPQCSPGTCNPYTNPQLGATPPQPQTPQGHLTYIDRVLPTNIFAHRFETCFCLPVSVYTLYCAINH
uniref:Ig-like domain-containing protein n=1 Tax=Castor canadensis TaxID=51338 RepID=A0A8C0W9K3_CASCN